MSAECISKAHCRLAGIRVSFRPHLAVPTSSLVFPRKCSLHPTHKCGNICGKEYTEEEVMTMKLSATGVKALMTSQVDTPTATVSTCSSAGRVAEAGCSASPSTGGVGDIGLGGYPSRIVGSGSQAGGTQPRGDRRRQRPPGGEAQARRFPPSGRPLISSMRRTGHDGRNQKHALPPGSRPWNTTPFLRSATCL